MKLAVVTCGNALNTMATTSANTATTRMIVRNANHNSRFLPRSPTYCPTMYPIERPSWRIELESEMKS